MHLPLLRLHALHRGRAGEHHTLAVHARVRVAARVLLLVRATAMLLPGAWPLRSSASYRGGVEYCQLLRSWCT